MSHILEASFQFRHFDAADVEGTIVNMPSLKRLDLSHNIIDRPPRLPPTLISLNLSDNKRLRDLSGLAVSNLRCLRELILRDCELGSTIGLVSLASLEKLDLSNNLISKVGGLEVLTKLSTLLLRDNRITHVICLRPLSCNKALENLDLRGNPVTSSNNYKTLRNYLSRNIRVLDGRKIKARSFAQNQNGDQRVVSGSPGEGVGPISGRASPSYSTGVIEGRSSPAKALLEKEQRQRGQEMHQNTYNTPNTGSVSVYNTDGGGGGDSSYLRSPQRHSPPSSTPGGAIEAEEGYGYSYANTSASAHNATNGTVSVNPLAPPLPGYAAQVYIADTVHENAHLSIPSSSGYASQYASGNNNKKGSALDQRSSVSGSQSRADRHDRHVNHDGSVYTADGNPKSRTFRGFSAADANAKHSNYTKPNNTNNSSNANKSSLSQSLTNTSMASERGRRGFSDESDFEKTGARTVWKLNYTAHNGPHDLPSGVKGRPGSGGQGQGQGKGKSGMKGGVKGATNGHSNGAQSKGSSGKDVHMSPSRSYRYYNSETSTADSSAGRGRGRASAVQAAAPFSTPGSNSNSNSRNHHNSSSSATNTNTPGTGAVSDINMSGFNVLDSSRTSTRTRSQSPLPWRNAPTVRPRPWRGLHWNDVWEDEEKWEPKVGASKNGNFVVQEAWVGARTTEAFGKSEANVSSKSKLKHMVAQQSRSKEILMRQAAMIQRQQELRLSHSPYVHQSPQPQRRARSHSPTNGRRRQQAPSSPAGVLFTPSSANAGIELLNPPPQPRSPHQGRSLSGTPPIVSSNGRVYDESLWIGGDGGDDNRTFQHPQHHAQLHAQSEYDEYNEYDQQAEDAQYPGDGDMYDDDLQQHGNGNGNYEVEEILPGQGQGRVHPSESDYAYGAYGVEDIEKEIEVAEAELSFLTNNSGQEREVEVHQHQQNRHKQQQKSRSQSGVESGTGGVKGSPTNNGGDLRTYKNYFGSLLDGDGASGASDILELELEEESEYNVLDGLGSERSDMVPPPPSHDWRNANGLSLHRHAPEAQTQAHAIAQAQAQNGGGNGSKYSNSQHQAALLEQMKTRQINQMHHIQQTQQQHSHNSGNSRNNNIGSTYLEPTFSSIHKQPSPRGSPRGPRSPKADQQTKEGNRSPPRSPSNGHITATPTRSSALHSSSQRQTHHSQTQNYSFSNSQNSQSPEKRNNAQTTMFNYYRTTDNNHIDYSSHLRSPGPGISQNGPNASRSATNSVIGTPQANLEDPARLTEKERQALLVHLSNNDNNSNSSSREKVVNLNINVEEEGERVSNALLFDDGAEGGYMNEHIDINSNNDSASESGRSSHTLDLENVFFAHEVGESELSVSAMSALSQQQQQQQQYQQQQQQQQQFKGPPSPGPGSGKTSARLSSPRSHSMEPPRAGAGIGTDSSAAAGMTNKNNINNNNRASADRSAHLLAQNAQNAAVKNGKAPVDIKAKMTVLARMAQIQEANANANANVNVNKSATSPKRNLAPPLLPSEASPTGEREGGLEGGVELDLGSTEMDMDMEAVLENLRKQKEDAFEALQAKLHRLMNDSADSSVTSI